MVTIGTLCETTGRTWSTFVVYYIPGLALLASSTWRYMWFSWLSVWRRRRKGVKWKAGSISKMHRMMPAYS